MSNPYPHVTFPFSEKEKENNILHNRWEEDQKREDNRAKQNQIAENKRAKEDRIAANERAKEDKQIQERNLEQKERIEKQRQNDFVLAEKNENSRAKKLRTVLKTELEKGFSPEGAYDRKKAELCAERDDAAEQERIKEELRRKEEKRKLEQRRLEILDSQYKNTFREWKETEMGQQWLKSVTGSFSVSQKNIDLKLFENYKAYKKKKYIENENIKKSIASKISRFYDTTRTTTSDSYRKRGYHDKFNVLVPTAICRKKWKQELHELFEDILQLEQTLINNYIEVSKDDDPNSDYFVDFLKAKIIHNSSEQIKSFPICNILKPRTDSYDPNAPYFDIIEYSKTRLYFEDEGTKKDIHKIKKDFEKINEKTIHGDSRIQVTTWKYPDEFISAIVNELQESRRKRNQEIIYLIKDELKSFCTRMTKIFKETYIKEKKIYEEIIEIEKQKKEEKKQEEKRQAEEKRVIEEEKKKKKKEKVRILEEKRKHIEDQIEHIQEMRIEEVSEIREKYIQIIKDRQDILSREENVLLIEGYKKPEVFFPLDDRFETLESEEKYQQFLNNERRKAHEQWETCWKEVINRGLPAVNVLDNCRWDQVDQLESVLNYLQGIPYSPKDVKVICKHEKEIIDRIDSFIENKKRQIEDEKREEERRKKKVEEDARILKIVEEKERKEQKEKEQRDSAHKNLIIAASIFLLFFGGMTAVLI